MHNSSTDCVDNTQKAKMLWYKVFVLSYRQIIIISGYCTCSDVHAIFLGTIHSFSNIVKYVELLNSFSCIYIIHDQNHTSLSIMYIQFGEHPNQYSTISTFDFPTTTLKVRELHYLEYHDPCLFISSSGMFLLSAITPSLTSCCQSKIRTWQCFQN